MGRETRRKREIGTTLFTWEERDVKRAALSRNMKLATYVREAVLAAAKQDLERAEPPLRPTEPAGFDRQAFVTEVADEVFRRLAGLAGERKKGSAEDSA